MRARQIRNVILRALAASTEQLPPGGHSSLTGAGNSQADAARLAQHTAARVFKECLQARRLGVGLG